MIAAIPYRADGVNHVLRRQPISARDLCCAGRTAAQLFTLGAQLRTGGAMDCAIDAAATQQSPVSCVDDRIELKRRDIGHADFESRGADFGSE